VEVSRFEDLIAWQRARELTHEVYRVTRQGAFARDFALRDQIQRAAVSIMSNLAEGFERGRRTEFHQFLSVAKGSWAEVRSQLYVALDVGYLCKSDADRLFALAAEVTRIVAGLRTAVARQRDADMKRSAEYREGH
jgi:four helix bundle protein